jgi:hypothetical protein
VIKLKVTTKLKEPMPKWYYGKAYENYDLNTVVWVVIGLHIFVKIGRYCNQVWNIWRGRKTWFDKQWLDAYTLGVKTGYFQRVNEENHNKFMLEELRVKLKLPHNQGQINERFN